MAVNNPNHQIAELEESTRHFGAGDKTIVRVLTALSKATIEDAESLVRFHETLLFLRAYPPSAKVLKQVEAMLKSFARRISELREADADLSPLDEPEVSGIAGTSVTSNFSYALVRWLVAKYPKQLSIDWDWFENEEQFGATMQRFLPLLEEDAMVEAHVPYRNWLDAARGHRNEIVWLIEQFDSLKLSATARAELYESLKLHVTWKFGSSVSRTAMKLRGRKTFFHDQPLIKRREVSLAGELNAGPLPIQKLSRAVGEKILDIARETSAVRYRELHGFSHGDAGRVLKADLGRGTEGFVMGVRPADRLPLRAYHAALIFKNGVPVAYFEGLSFFERMESGFNLYYTFRDGETAWLYARILRLMRQLLGVTVFSIDPYQVGHENEEGIESGAFWFYRKLGFRPVRPEIMKLTLAEERKMTKDRRYRTSARALRKLAAGPMLFETPGGSASRTTREWTRFEIRKIGLAVQRHMAEKFAGDATKIRAHSAQFVRQALALDKQDGNEHTTRLINDLALALEISSDVHDWTTSEMELACRILLAKASSDEALYLKAMQKHASLRASLIQLGSKGAR
jgi:hypothetical protein